MFDDGCIKSPNRTLRPDHRNVSSYGATATQKVNDENYKRDHKQQMDQAASHMETEAEKPQNQKHYENCPKHICSPLLIFKS
jgi:hypothetical protein